MSRATPISVLAAAVLAAAACGSQPAAQAPPPSAAAARHAAPGTQTATAPPAAPPGPTPAVRVARSADNGRDIAIRIQNRAPQPVELAPALSVERRDAHGFAALPGVELSLRAHTPDARCVRLAPGAELRPPPWPRERASAGTYRFVLHGCDRSYRVDGEPFELE